MRKSCSRWNSRVKGSFWSYPAGCDGGPGLENLKSSHRKLRVSLRRWGTRSWSRRPRWWGARSAGTVERRDLLGGPTAPARPRALTVRAGFSRAPPRPVTWQPPTCTRVAWQPPTSPCGSPGATQFLNFSQPWVFQMRTRRACLWPKSEGKAQRFEALGSHSLTSNDGTFPKSRHRS